MKRYKIWNKRDNIYTLTGKMFTPEEWMKEHAFLTIPDVVPVIDAGEVNGAYVGTLGLMKAAAENAGAVFPDGLSNEELLAAIEAWEDERNAAVDPTNLPITPEERTAAALEFIAMSSLPNEEV